MSTLRPLVDSSSSERARLLLRAARADGPRPGAASRTLTALGVVGTTAKVALAAGGSAGASTGIAAGGAASLPLIAAKWLLVGMLGGGVLASGARWAFTEREPDAAPAQPANVAPSYSATSLEPAIAPVPVIPITDTGTAPQPVASVAVKSTGTAGAPSASPQAAATPFAAPSQAAFDSPEQSKLLHDIALLDDVRSALKRGDTARARALLTRYQAERQTHVLDREAELLRVRALPTDK